MTDILENNTEVKSSVPAKSHVITEPKEFARRAAANIFVLLFIFSAAFVTLVFNTNMVEEKITDIKNCFYDYAAKIGLVLDDIVVSGRIRTPKQDLLQALQLKRGDNFLKIDVHELKKRVESLPWIKSAIIKRKFFPNVVEINLQEKIVRSLWQINEKFHPVDEDGRVIDAPYVPDAPILLIVGDGAPQNINHLLAAIDSNKKVLERVKVANFISHRRWNLVLDDVENGITIKLPEDDVEQAWKKLLKLDAVNGILKRKLTIIDLRLKGKVTVTLKKTDGKAPLLLKNQKESGI